MTEAEQKLVTQIINTEYQVAKTNKSMDTADYEESLDQLHSEHGRRDYEWMSDRATNEMASSYLVDLANGTNQYFQSRDYVEVALEGDKPDDKKRCAAIKKLINRSLNNRNIYHFQKDCRMRGIRSIMGWCWVEPVWEHDVTVVETEEEVPDVKWVMDPATGTEVGEQTTKKIKVPRKHIKKDQFNYVVHDPRMVFTDNSYVYSAREKDYVIIQDEVTYEELKAQKDEKGYINLEDVKNLTEGIETDTSKESYNKQPPADTKAKPAIPKWDRLRRFGKHYFIVKERDEYGNPTKIEDGLNPEGQKKDGAELVESIIEMVVSGSSHILIRKQPTPYIDCMGRPYRNLIRAMCYIDPSDDNGMSDGKYWRENQITINDIVNAALDRTKLSLMPTFLARRWSMEENDSVRWSPGGKILVDDISADLKEMKIDPNVAPALQMLGFFRADSQTVTANTPNAMGNVGDVKASTTATAFAGAEQRTNLRANFKSLVLEYTYYCELYWMDIQMTWQFAEPETAQALLGNDVYYFDPSGDYSYQPITSNIEQDASKNKKIQNYDQAIGRLSGMVEAIPQLLQVIGFMVGEQLKLMGHEMNEIGDMVEALMKAKPQGPNGEQVKDGKEPPTSNQAGMLQSPEEQNARGMVQAVKSA